MQSNYDKSNPKAWVTKKRWCRETGRDAPDRHTPALNEEQWQQRFPEDPYPDGRSPRVFCLPEVEEPRDQRSLELRIERLEDWREQSQYKLDQLGHRLGARAKQTSNFAEALRSIAELLDEQSDESQAIADRLLALSLDRPGEVDALGEETSHDDRDGGSRH